MNPSLSRSASADVAAPGARKGAAGLVRRAVRGLLARAGVGDIRPVEAGGDAAVAPQRVLYVANSLLATLQIGFIRPLRPLVERGELAWQLLADPQVSPLGIALSGAVRRSVFRRLDAFRPHVIVFCRYSGAFGAAVVEWARAHGVATVFHIDDDLLAVPADLGAAKHAFHNHPRRLVAIRYLLQNADLVYCSTPVLLERMRREGAGDRGLAGRVHCPGQVLRAPPAGGDIKIGYMGYDHARDFELALPAVVRIMERNPQVRFELFGPIAKPAALERFGDRVTQVAAVRDYDEFLRKFASLGWSIGICPLADTPFNRAKADNKWVEYTSVGAAVVATAGSIYDRCCADGCGWLVTGDAAWEQALQSLVDNPGQRAAMAGRAGARLADEYSMDALRRQVEQVFREARARASRHVGHAG